MSKRSLILASAIVLGVAAFAAAAEHHAVPADVMPPGATANEAKLSVLIDTIRANRKALVAVNLHLNDKEAADFWPLRHLLEGDERHRRPHDGDRAGVHPNYATLSNETALKLSTDFLDAEAERLKIRRTYIDQFAKILPGRTVARFYQIENKMDAVIRYDLAATIPVVDEKAAAPAAK
jgi:hypothetical protein